MKPRAHAEIIKQWADGHEIQYRRPGSDEWVDSPDPAFVSDYEYRVKPAREYPVVSLNHTTMNSAFQKLVRAGYNGAEEFANSAIRHMIDYGHVAPREEFDQVANECKRATKTLVAAGYTDCGGELWKPPLGKPNEGMQGLIDCLRVIRAKAKASGTVVMNMECDFGMVSLEEFVDRALKAAGMT